MGFDVFQCLYANLAIFIDCNDGVVGMLCFGIPLGIICKFGKALHIHRVHYSSIRQVDEVMVFTCLLTFFCLSISKHFSFKNGDGFIAKNIDGGVQPITRIGYLRWPYIQVIGFLRIY